MLKWTACKDNQPLKDGDYFVTKKFWNYNKEPKYLVTVCSFATKLSNVDNYDFKGVDRAGWFEYDSEWGMYECNNVIAWAELPKPYKED